MGSNHLNEHFRRQKMEEEQELNAKNGVVKPKFEIPLYDPFSGERNPYYEELTGKKHPLDE